LNLVLNIKFNYLYLILKLYFLRKTDVISIDFWKDFIAFLA